ncbi:MAG TPA: LD-carboxypeptidase [Thermoanaerobaculia bacterium]|nr:LD-carboxypeptidase [Thermoanaerobaculia bacterium]
MIPPARLPPAVRPGDRVGIAALSGPVDPERLTRGLAALRRMGFDPVPAANLASKSGLFAGNDAARLAAFHELAADPTLGAIVFARGGYGVMRLLPAIDWDLLARRPRAYVGYSDLTPFLLEVVRRLGLVAFHGPMVAADLARGLDPMEEESFLGALAGRYPVAHPFARSLRGGDARGPLLGGCLSLLTATLGTPYFPDLAGAILFWEDVDEPPYRLDRMLTHLRLSGSLAALQGMIVGHLDGAGKSPSSGLPSPGGEAAGGDPGEHAASPSAVALPALPELPTLPALIMESVAGFAWPLAWGLESGHRAPNRTLPLGSAARLDAAAALLVLGEG